MIEEIADKIRDELSRSFLGKIDNLELVKDNLRQQFYSILPKSDFSDLDLKVIQFPDDLNMLHIYPANDNTVLAMHKFLMTDTSNDD